jgi:hypothetical protein
MAAVGDQPGHGLRFPTEGCPSRLVSDLVGSKNDYLKICLV